MSMFSLHMRHLKWLILIHFLTFSILVPFISSKLPFSKLYHVFNDDNFITQKANSLNAARLREAKNYFKTIDKEASRDFYQSMKDCPELDLVIVIVTVNRMSSDGLDLGYLLQTAAIMDRLVKNDRFFKNRTLFVCNVDRKPDNHSDANLLMSYLPFVQRYGKQSSLIKKISNVFQYQKLYDTKYYSSKYEKETVDYMFCLETALFLNPNFILLIEDDTMPHENIFELLKHNIDSHLHYINDTGQLMQRSFSYLKLYYPQRWQGYANDVLRIMELFSVAFLGAGIFTLIYVVCASKRKTSIMCIYFLSGGIYFILFALILGRQNVIELRRLSKYFYTFISSPGCCTQAMMYPKQIIPHLLNFLGNEQTSKNYHSDIAIYNFVQKSGVPAYQIEPNLFHHIGMYTSLNNYGPKKAEEFIFNVHI